MEFKGQATYQEDKAAVMSSPHLILYMILVKCRNFKLTRNGLLRDVHDKSFSLVAMGCSAAIKVTPLGRLCINYGISNKTSLIHVFCLLINNFIVLLYSARRLSLSQYNGWRDWSGARHGRMWCFQFSSLITKFAAA